MEPQQRQTRELDSWKEIAEHLEINVRTAQRWEEQRGLPVHRLSGDRARVSARVEELNEWKRIAFARASWWGNVRFLRVYSLVTTGALLIAAALFLTHSVPRWRAGKPSAHRWDGKQFVVLDSNGQELWRHTFDGVPAPEYFEGSVRENRLWFGDLDGDSSVETVIAYCCNNDNSKSNPVEIFSEGGKFLWPFIPSRVVRDVAQEYSPIFHHRSLAVMPSPARDGAKYVLVTSVHEWGHPSQLAVLDHRGRLVGEYWHSGHLGPIASMDLDGDGIVEILAGGVDEGYRQAVLLVFDPRNVSGASVQPIGDPHQLQEFKPGSEKAIIRFPRTALNQKAEQFNIAEMITAAGGKIHVKVREHARSPTASLLWMLDSDLTVNAIEPSVALKSAYLPLAARGQLREYSDAEIEALKQKVQLIRK